MSEKLIGIDVGGTSARVARFGSAESPEIDGQTTFEISGEYEQDIPKIAEAIRELLEGTAPDQVAFAVAGHIDHEAGVLVSSPNTKDWKGRALRDDLSEAVGSEVLLINDAQAAALSEATFGEHGGKDFWFLIWGTGIGGSIVEFRDGKFDLVDAEPGHQILNWDEDAPECGCGRKGCLEAYASGAGLEKRFGVSSAADLIEEQWDDGCEWLARGLYNLIRIHPTDRIVLGGGVALKQAARLSVVEARTNELLEGFRKIVLEGATYGDNAGVVGAMAALRRQS